MARGIQSFDDYLAQQMETTMADKPRKKRTDTAPPGETKAGKFSRLASKRMTRILGSIGKLGNLAGPGYEYTPEQIGRMVNAIQTETEKMSRRFDKTQVQSNTFTV